MLIRDLLNDQIAVLRDLSDRTVTLYGETLHRFAEHLGHEPTIDDFDDLVVARFLRWRAQQPNHRGGKISPASCAKDAAHLKTIWSWCAKKRLKKSTGELIEFPDFARPRVPKPRPVAFTIDELQKLVDAARHRRGYIDGLPAAWYWTTKILAMFQTGERIGAVMALCWGEVDLEAPSLTFLAATRKGHRETITRGISPDLADMLRAQKRAPGELVWPWVKDRRMQSCYASLRVLCRVAGVDYHPFHSIRKSTASYMKLGGASAKTQLGHASEEMAERHYYDQRITGVQSALDYLPPLDLGRRPLPPKQEPPAA
jgi:integrase